MFLGRSRRPVNLGSRKQATTHDALRNAEKQRSKRQTQRREAQAAQSIQQAWHSYKLLREARISFARSFLTHGAARLDSEAFAYVLPIVAVLSEEEQHAVINRYEPNANHEYCHLLVARLPFLWTHRPLDPTLRDAGFGILRHQNPPSIPAQVVRSIIHLGATSETDPTAILEWASAKYPTQVLAIVLTESQNDIKALPLAVIRPMFTIRSLPDKPNQDAVSALIEKISADTRQSWPLLSVLLGALQARHAHLSALESELCNRSFVQTVVSGSSALVAAQSIATLLELFPGSRPSVLLYVLMASKPSPLNAFWDAYNRTQETSLLHVVVELFSYWLLVATDAELMSNSSMGLLYDDFRDLAMVVRDLSFDILWTKDPNRRTVLDDFETGVLKLLRQLYTRDSRRQLFASGFWLMEDRILKKNNQFLQALDEGLFEADDDVEGLEDLGDDNSSTGLVLKATPAVRILEHAPFFIGFETRVSLFYHCIDKDQDSRQVRFEGPRHFVIRRENLYQDAQALFQQLGPKLKSHLRIRFMSNGVEEQGIDGGGLMKELLITLCTEALIEDPKSGRLPLFVETAHHTLAPNPVFGEDVSLWSDEVGNQYFFLGQLIGKCIYENLLIDVEFAPFFLAKWNRASAGHSIRSTFDDLYLLDAELYNSMAKLHNMYGEDVDALGLDFTIMGSRGQEVSLRPQGFQIAVTDANKLEYMRELANYKLNTSTRPQTAKFLQGLGQIISLEWLNMFSPQEISKLLSGETQDIDIGDLKRHTEVSGFEFHETALANFWKVLEELTPEQRGKFLKFVTSAPKGPLLGFDKLDPHFGIRCAGADDNRLPTSSTCVNLLKLPAYSSIEILRKKLLYSIESGAGFDLS